MDVTSDQLRAVIENAGVSVDVASIRSDISLSKAGVDSLEMMNVFLAIEERFDIKISDEDAALLKTVDDIIHYLRRCGP